MSFDFEVWADDHLEISHKVVGSDGQHEELVCRCPSCRRMLFYVNASTGAYICYRCSETGEEGFRGGLVALVSLIEDIPYAKAKEKIKVAREGFTIAKFQKAYDRMMGRRYPKKRVVSTVKLPDSYVPVFDARAQTWHVPAYMTQRGIPRRIARRYALGYCTSGRYEGRLILPVRMRGKLRSFQARTMRDASPKYLHPAGIAKADLLYGFDELLPGESCVVVEGPLDVLRLQRYEIPAVALMGKTATHAQGVALSYRGVDRITILLDADARVASAKAAKALSTFLEVHLAFLPEGTDPDSASRAQVEAALASARPPRLSDSLELRRRYR